MKHGDIYRELRASVWDDVICFVAMVLIGVMGCNVTNLNMVEAPREERTLRRKEREMSEEEIKERIRQQMKSMQYGLTEQQFYNKAQIAY